VNEPVAVLSWASVAEQLTGVAWLRMNVVPDAGLQFTGTEPSTRSVARTPPARSAHDQQHRRGYIHGVQS
jgi:hypothetical protein